MKFYKRLLSIALSAAMAAQLSFAAFAQNDITTEQTSDNSAEQTESVSAAQTNISTENQTGDSDDIITVELSPEQNDPSYWKNVRNLSLARSSTGTATISDAYGSANLIHNSKFDKYTKSYGIDVSQYQYTIDWNKVKNAGIDFAIIRLGYRGWGAAGTLATDPYFYQNINGAKKAGLKVGVYFYTQAITKAEVIQEAQYCISKLGGIELDLPIYYDIEAVYTGSSAVGRLDGAGLTSAQKTQNCKTFCQEIENSGYKPGVYSYTYYLNNNIDGPGLGNLYDLWLADYTTKTRYGGNYTTWQYTSSGQVDGIPARVDMNVRYSNPNAEKQVQNLHTSESTQNSITLSWDHVYRASGYRVYMKNSKGEYVFKKNAIANSCTITGLRTGGIYFFRVIPYYNSDGTTAFVSGKSKLGTFSATHTSGTVAAKGEGLQCTASTENSITISWSQAPYRCDGYQVVYYNVDTDNYEVLDNVAETTYTRTGYSPAAKRRFAIRPYYTYGGQTYYGLFSDSIIATSKPKGTTNVGVTGIDGTSAKVSWKNLGSGIVYDILVAENGKYVEKARSVTGSSYTIKNLLPMTDSKLKIRSVVLYKGVRYAFNYSPVINFTTKPTPPSEVKPGSVYSEDRTSVTWNSVANASKYQIYYCKEGEKDYKYYSDVSSSATSATLLYLEPNQRYSVKIRTVSNNIYSDFSEPVTVCTKPSVPANFKVISTADKNITLIWDKVDNALGYRIYMYDNEKNKFVYLKSYTGTKAVIKDLSSGVYRFKIATISSAGDKKYISDQSNEVKVYL